jgi:hypothetical protein
MKSGNLRNLNDFMGMGVGRAVALGLVGLGLGWSLAGCRVHVDKDANGKEKTVQVDTPFGGVHVNTDQTSAADLGLPVYPGAKLVTDDEKHKSADVHLGFGQWQLRVKAVNYTTPDSKDQVIAFYKKALGRFGDVITCQGSSVIGAPSQTHEGLTCDEHDNNGKVKINDGDINVTHDYQLKAGSKRHQHIVGFEDNKGETTRFVLVALDLPSGMGSDDGKQ